MKPLPGLKLKEQESTPHIVTVITIELCSLNVSKYWADDAYVVSAAGILYYVYNSTCVL